MNGTDVDYTDLLKSCGKFLYLVNPRETTFQFPDEVPDYQQQVWLPFFILIVLEHVILSAKEKGGLRLNDQVTSLSHWLLQESGRVFFRGAEYWAYIAIHDRYQWWKLPWDSPWTWYLTALAVDFCYYWVHRSNHEVHFLWAHHQVHHSSEEFNLAVGLRQSVLQHWCNFIFYLPLAFFIPPSHFIAHNQFNLIYQLWIHTTVIDDLGPLEWVLNTPKHHRVHHGCNLYCLDKNYGGVLIVWDRIFGTFMEEKKDNEIIYGLVVSPRTFNPVYLQTFYVRSMMDKCFGMKTIKDKLGTVWKGPSWFPGGPRLGLDEFKINVTSRIKYDPSIPRWQSVYIILHFLMVLINHWRLCEETQDSGNGTMGPVIVSNVFALTAIGLLLDRSAYAPFVEVVRCISCLILTRNADSTLDIVMWYTYIASCCFWIVRLLTKAHAKSD